MRIARVRLHTLTLPLSQPLRTGYGVVARRAGSLVELTDEDGVSGWGEALPLPGFGGEPEAECAGALRRGVARLLGLPADDGPTVGAAFGPAGAFPVASAAVEMARLDLIGRATQRSAAACLGSSRGVPSLPVGALLRADAPAALEAEARRAVAAGFETLKLKVAAGPLPVDLERVAAVRRAAPPPVRLRLDANAAWSERDAARAVRLFSSFELEWLEQPVSAGDPDGLARLRRHATDHGVDIAADESAGSEAAVRLLLDRGAVDAVVIKLPVLGGPWRAREVAAAAQREGLKVSVTSFLDSTLGIAAAAHVAASLPEAPAACGLATAELLAADLAPPWRVEAGALWFPEAPGPGPDSGMGLGVLPRLERLPGVRLEVDVSAGAVVQSTGRR